MRVYGRVTCGIYWFLTGVSCLSYSKLMDSTESLGRSSSFFLSGYIGAYLIYYFGLFLIYTFIYSFFISVTRVFFTTTDLDFPWSILFVLELMFFILNLFGSSGFSFKGFYLFYTFFIDWKALLFWQFCLVSLIFCLLYSIFFCSSFEQVLRWSF